MNFREYMGKGIILLDGAMGSRLQSAGLTPGEMPERWSLSHPDVIEKIHREYIAAGANVVLTNTFGANPLRMEDGELCEVITAAVGCARRAVLASGREDVYVALDIGPCGRMLAPLGDLDFEAAVAAFSRVVTLGASAGCDLIFIETMGDIYEARAALLAAREACSLPVLVSCAFGADGRLFTGATPAVVATVLSSLGADMIGANCSVGPREMVAVLSEMAKYSTVPLFAKPNAGMPSVRDGRTFYDVSAADFAAIAPSLVSAGACALGGCCGTDPTYIEALSQAVKNLDRPTPVSNNRTVISSYTTVCEIGRDPVLIGERINPTGKPRLKEALRTKDYGYLAAEAIGEEDAGAHVLDVNVGLPGTDEVELITHAVREIQGVTTLPLCIDTANHVAMEAALRLYNGKALINSVNGKRASLDSILPLAKKYGGVLICLTLDEQGIPPTAEGRFAIAEKIIAAAREHGIPESELVFDPLCLAVSADSGSGRELLRALEMFRAAGLKTSLGISNISFGLPERDAVNSTFFALTLGAGLNAAIINPHSARMMEVYHTFRALSGIDEGCRDYIDAATNGNLRACTLATAVDGKNAPTIGAKSDPVCENGTSTLAQAVKRGMRDRARELTRTLLDSLPPLEIIDREIIPALNEVGVAYEKGTCYLPTLLLAAEAASSAFEVIKSVMTAAPTGRCTVILATVEGDVHDIGKNIVRLLLENYGFTVVDLGRDVPPDAILSAAREHSAPLVGLSALMTTTVPAMERTVALLHSELPGVRVMVGGAVLTPEYAAAIGADFYSPDAMGAVRYAERVCDEPRE